jgi:hypothetical protein
MLTMGVDASDCKLAVDLPRYIELDTDGDAGGRKIPGWTTLPPPPFGMRI